MVSKKDCSSFNVIEKEYYTQLELKNINQKLAEDYKKTLKSGKFDFYNQIAKPLFSKGVFFSYDSKNYEIRIRFSKNSKMTLEEVIIPIPS